MLTLVCSSQLYVMENRLPSLPWSFSYDEQSELPNISKGRWMMSSYL